MSEKLPLQPVKMLRAIAPAIKGYPKAAMFELADRGYNSLFEQLISCVISIRTLDETTIPVSLRLFQRARTPEALAALSDSTLLELLRGSTFAEGKVATMKAVARAALEGGGHLPADYEQLTSIKGIGPKCANLALGVATGSAAISVDVHVHRVVNRWGLVATRSPEKTGVLLQKEVPEKEWVHINRLLMPFGKHICTAALPRCSTCPVLQWCRQVGVVRHR